MQLLKIFAFFVVMLLYESQGECEGFCNQKPVMSVCSESSMTNRKDIYINTANVPEIINISCVCFVSNSIITDKLLFKMLYITDTDKIKFEINETVLDNMSTYNPLFIRNITELKFTTHGYLSNEGACLVIYSAVPEETTFNISCKGISQTTVTNPYTEYTPKTTTMPPKRRKETVKSNRYILVGIVSSVIGCILIVVTVLTAVICFKRRRNEQNITHEANMSEMNEVSKPDKCQNNKHINNIQETNEYESLDRQAQASSDDEYQHFVSDGSDLNNSDSDKKYENFYQQQTDSSSTEEKSKNIPYKKEDNAEYESLKRKVPVDLYETLQTNNDIK